MVLPSQNLTGDPEQEYLCDGLTEEMIAHPRVASTLATWDHRPHVGDALQEHDEASRRNRAASSASGYLLETSLRRIGDRVRVTAQLIDAETQGQVWVNQYERDARDVVALQREVAAAVARRTP